MKSFYLLFYISSWNRSVLAVVSVVHHQISAGLFSCSVTHIALEE